MVLCPHIIAVYDEILAEIDRIGDEKPIVTEIESTDRKCVLEWTAYALHKVMLNYTGDFTTYSISCMCSDNLYNFVIRDDLILQQRFELSSDAFPSDTQTSIVDEICTIVCKNNTSIGNMTKLARIGTRYLLKF